MSNQSLLQPVIAVQCCEHCDDGEGDCVFPYTGLAPHKHVLSNISGSLNVLGSTQFLDQSNYPANFSPDPEEKGMGTYTHCLHCDAPDNDCDASPEQQIKYWKDSASGWAKNYSQLQDETNRLVRELDVAINGENAAPQAMLCDLVAQTKQKEGFVPVAAIRWAVIAGWELSSDGHNHEWCNVNQGDLSCQFDQAAEEILKTAQENL